jgi:hypothetical protein
MALFAAADGAHTVRNLWAAIYLVRKNLIRDAGFNILSAIARSETNVICAYTTCIPFLQIEAF